MIEIAGNLFNYGTAHAVCITTNGSITKGGRGVMGRGVALQATQIWPHIALYLGKHLKEHGNHVGILIPCGSSGTLEGTKWAEIVSFPVKRVWHERATPALILQSCEELVDLTNQRGWRRVSLPRPGCGNGGLKWPDVKPLIAPLLDDRFAIVELPTVFNRVP